MTSHTTNFRTSIDTSVFMPVVNYVPFTSPTGPFNAQSRITAPFNGFVVSQPGAAGGTYGDGNYLLHKGDAPKSYAVSSGANNGNNYRLTLSSPQSDWDPLTVLMIRVSGATNPANINGVWPAFVVSNTEIDILGANDVALTGTVTVQACDPAGVANRNSIQSVNALSTAESSLNYIAMWARLSNGTLPGANGTTTTGLSGGGPGTELKRGYALRLVWDANGARKLQIMRVSPTTGLTGLEVVAERSANLNLHTSNGSDLGVTQRLVFIVTDDDDGLGGDPQGVICRGYLNRTATNGKIELDNPDVEYIDRGSNEAPIYYENNGLWALTFGKQDSVFVDAWQSQDAFTWPQTAAARPSEFSTFLDAKNLVRRIVGRGETTNLDSTALEDSINYAQIEMYNRFGGGASWRRKLETITVESIGDNLYRLPGHVKNLHLMWDTEHNERVRWRLVNRDERGSLVIVLYHSDTSFRALFDLKPRWMTDDTDLLSVPRQHEELLGYIAALRHIEQRRDPAFYQTCQTRIATLQMALEKDLQTDQQMEDPYLSVDIPDVTDWRTASDWRRYPIY